jgi:Uma2 family endonuclease
MDASVARLVRISPEEYLIRERAAAYKSEYIDGVVYAIAGGSPRHSMLQSNVVAILWASLEESPCTTHGSDLKVWAASARSFFYPDATVICGEPKYTSNDALVNPSFLLEVLSPSTEHFDRTRKFDMYQTIPSLKQYALVYQDEPRVETLTKSEQGFWVFRSFAGLEATADFDAIGVKAAISKIYSRIEFPVADA